MQQQILICIPVLEKAWLMSKEVQLPQDSAKELNEMFNRQPKIETGSIQATATKKG